MLLGHKINKFINLNTIHLDPYPFCLKSRSIYTHMLNQYLIFPRINKNIKSIYSLKSNSLRFLHSNSNKFILQNPKINYNKILSKNAQRIINKSNCNQQIQDINLDSFQLDSVNLNKIRVFGKGKYIEFEFYCKLKMKDLKSINSNISDVNKSKILSQENQFNDSTLNKSSNINGPNINNLQNAEKYENALSNNVDQIETWKENFIISAEILRVYSSSANMMRQHSEIIKRNDVQYEIQQSERKLVYGKHNVMIESIELLGNYAIQISFSDGHKHGIYSFDLIRQIGLHQCIYIRHYLRVLQNNNVSRRGRISRASKEIV